MSEKQNKSQEQAEDLMLQSMHGVNNMSLDKFHADVLSTRA